MIAKSLIALALATSTLGVSTLTAPKVVPAAFQPKGTAGDAQPLTFTLHLQESNIQGLADRVDAIAASGGKWLSDDEVASYIRPTSATTAAVNAFLAAAKIPASAISTNTFGEQVTVSTTVANAKTLFPNTNFAAFNYKSQNLVKTLALQIPSPVSGAITHVSGLTEFAQLRHLAPAPQLDPLVVTPDVASAAANTTNPCNPNAVTPACLRYAYETADYVPSRTLFGNNPDIVVMGYIGQYVSQSDLTQFLKKYRPDAGNYKLPIKTAVGGINDQSDPGVEAMLDVETVVSQTYPLRSEFLSYGTPDYANDVFGETFAYFASGPGAKARPSVVSISYGDDEKNYPVEAFNTMCKNALKLVALGTTPVVSSGDAGVDGNGPPPRSTDICLGTAESPFIPTYPGGCQYVSSIGATRNFNPEIMVGSTVPGAQDFFSGAGRSNYAPIPRYQAKQVAAYDKLIAGTGFAPAVAFNATGRAFPDYAANGLNYIVIFNGTEYLVGGTSASAPTVASIFTLLNNALQRNFRPNLGFSQPKLYPLGDVAFNDITEGGSYDCGTSSSLTPIGFPAKPKWDNAAGNGTPKFKSLRKGLGAFF